MRLPAREIEAAVAERIAEELGDPLELAAKAWITIPMGEVSQIIARSAAVATVVANHDRKIVLNLVKQVRVLSARIEIDVVTQALADILHMSIAPEAPSVVTLISELRLKRTGRAVRLIQNNGAGVAARAPDPTLVKLLIRARRWWNALKSGDIDVPTLAMQEGVTGSYIIRIVRLAFLTPAVVDALLAGTQRAGIDGGTLTASSAIPMRWSEQRALYLPRSEGEGRLLAGLSSFGDAMADPETRRPFRRGADRG